MRIDKIKLHNFRIYKGSNEIVFKENEGKNISLIAGKNGFGKTTFLTSLIWTMYGNLMGQVEEKYKKDIKTAGGYQNYLLSNLNKNVFEAYNKKEKGEACFSAEVHLVDVLIPSIPCKSVVIRRSFDLKTKDETLKIFIDGQENELTKEVGYEVFINDFILPREIAKFFFFDAEKIVSLAEAKSKEELRSLSRAYSEVLGIKKYEDLKYSLSTLLTKLKRQNAVELDAAKLEELISKEKEIQGMVNFTQENQDAIEDELVQLKQKTDLLQEKLIREGNEISVDELIELKTNRDQIKKEIEVLKVDLRKSYELLPLLIAQKNFEKLIEQLDQEENINSKKIGSAALVKELNLVSKELTKDLKANNYPDQELKELQKAFERLIAKRQNNKTTPNAEVLLDYSEDAVRTIKSTYNYLTTTFKNNLEILTKKDKDLRLKLTRVQGKIKRAEARKDNPLAQKIRQEKIEVDQKIHEKTEKKESYIAEIGALKHQLASNHKVLSEYEKNFKLIETDRKKYEVTLKLLDKLNVLTAKIKEEKKYSLQKSILLGLKKLMHKDDFINSVNVRIDNDVMDIDLLDAENRIINKDSLSKGEQQLYATALLKALVDESGINFPVFIDSPLQKFDVEHSSNVIQQFYPTISEQVVLFPLLEKELSLEEFNQLKPHLNGTYLIENTNQGSTITEYKQADLFLTFKANVHVLAN